MTEQKQVPPTPLSGIRYFQPLDGFRLTGRDGAVDLDLSGIPVPLLEEDFPAAIEAGGPDYDRTGRGIYQALRINPDCAYSSSYADILKTSYPHIIAEIGGEVIMLDAKEVDAPYLDRKVAMLKIMALMEPDNAGLWREIGRTLMEKGSRLEASHQAVQSWYGAEQYLSRSLELAPSDIATAYQSGEVHYVLGHYEKASEIWGGLLDSYHGGERRALESRIAEIKKGDVPKVPAVDYLTALSVALEMHSNGDVGEAVAIIEDLLADPHFCVQFPMDGIYRFLERSYRDMGLNNAADEIRGRC